MAAMRYWRNVSRSSGKLSGTVARISASAAARSRATRCCMNASDIETSSKRGVRIGGTDTRSAPAVRAVGQVLEQVELRHDADRTPGTRRDDGRRATGCQQPERVVEGIAQVHKRERPVHHPADRPVDGRGAAE